MGENVRRLGRRLAGTADGSPSPLPMHTAKLRQATVDSVADDSVTVVIAGDDSGEPAPVGWVGNQPADGATVWLLHDGTQAVVIGTQKQPPAAALENHGTVTGQTTNGSGDITISHGLPTTPTTVLASPGPTSSTGRVIEVHTLAATTFKVRCYSIGGGLQTSNAGWTVHWHAWA
jgi:hypothetical protein